MKKVYYSKILGKEFLIKLKEELREKFKNCKRIAIKIHFGEPGNNFAFKPEQVKPITDLLKELKLNYFLYDSSVAYDSPRNNPISHKKAAVEKGWDELGEIKTDDDFVVVKGKNIDYEVCKHLTETDGVLVITHFKGHYCSGFGGAIKNLGMGALTKKSKAKIHDGGRPEIIGNCIQCRICEEACPIKGIKVTDRPEFGECYGCSNCIYACPNNVLKPKINFFDTLLADGANSAFYEFKKTYFISYLVNIAKHCDCEENPKEIIADDCGYLFSEDGVAIDKASYDIIFKKMNEDVFEKYNKKSGIKQIEEAEKFGMGISKYDLEVIN